MEEEARRIVTEAEAEAKAELAAAHEKAEELERTVVQRHETLQREAKMLEERKQRVLESLRDLAAQIQDALVEPTERPASEEMIDALEVHPAVDETFHLREVARGRRVEELHLALLRRGESRDRHGSSFTE